MKHALIIAAFIIAVGIVENLDGLALNIATGIAAAFIALTIAAIKKGDHK